jgi:general secretion pathway protein L
MTTLVVLIPARPRVHAADRVHTHASAQSPAADDPLIYSYVVTPDGSTVVSAGQASANELPHADSLVAVIGDHDASWHRMVVPKAPKSKVRAALQGALEEQLLDDADAVHVAIEPEAVPGQQAWVCAVNKAWLRESIARLEAHGSLVDRVVPMSWPEDTPLGHFSEAAGAPVSREGHAPLQLTWSDISGVATIQLQGGLSKSLLAQWSASPARWSSHPSIAPQAERWLGATVIALRDEARALQAMRSLWNLRQFDLARSHRGALAVRETWKRFMGADFRAARWGLAALVGLNVLALNAYALHLKGQVSERTTTMKALLREAHPQAKFQLEAPIEMQRETDRLRSAAGRLGDTDLETVLGAMAAAWPEGRSPAENLRYEGDKISLSSAGWTDSQVGAFRDALKPVGWVVDRANGALALSRARQGSEP